MEDTVKLTNVSKSFNGFSIDNLSFSLKKGFITGFIGPNGAGKTTTIKLIMNLLKRDSGSIEVFGLDNATHGKQIRERIGFVYADNHFYDHLSVEAMKRVIASFYKQWDEDAFQRYVKEFNLPRNRAIKKLSRGMKMKFAIAVALSHNADLIIMDEPTSGLDPVFRSEILDILTEVIQDEEKTIFFSTHITSDLEQIADFVTYIYDGRIVFSEEKDTILEQYRIVKGAKELLDADTRQVFTGFRETGVGFEGLTRDIAQAQALFEDHVIFERPSLEEIMVYTARSGQRA